MPEAIATPTRSPSSPASEAAPEKPASCQASIAATRANWAERSSRRALTRSRTSAGSTAIRPAIRTGRGSAHSSVRARTPERPATRASQVLGTSPPTGLVVPIPVTTTRVRLMTTLRSKGFWNQALRCRRRGSGVAGRVLDERDGVADGLEVLDLVVRDRHAELLLGGHDDLDHGERVDIEVVDEGLVELDVLGRDSRYLVDDLCEVGADLFGGGHGQVFPFGWVRWSVDQGTMMTCAAYARPAPNAISSAVSPLRACPSSIMRSRARGTEAAEVLPCSAMSRAMRTRSGSFMARAMASMMRMLAWCGTKTSRSSGLMPARSRDWCATFAIVNDAQRNTGLPCMVRCGITGASAAIASRQSSSCRIRSNCSPSEPQTTGPIPGVSLGPTTAAPAPSAKMNAVPRSPTSVRSKSPSTPITSA